MSSATKADKAGGAELSASDKKAIAKGRQLIPDDEAEQQQTQKLALIGAAGLLAGVLFGGVGVVIGGRIMSKRANAKFEGQRT